MRPLRRDWTYERLTTPGVLDARQINGTMWGHQGMHVLRSGDDWGTTEVMATVPGSGRQRILRMYLLDDDDTLLISAGRGRGLGKLYRYSIASATFTGPVLEFPSGYALGWNFTDHDGAVFTAEYGFPLVANNPRRVYRSLDHGATWALVGEVDQPNHHVHQILYDHHTDTLWVSQGDLTAKLYQADGPDHDVFVNRRERQPTAGLVASDYLLWGQDSGPAGIERYVKATDSFEFVFSLVDFQAGAFRDYVFSMCWGENGRAIAATAGETSMYSLVGVFYADAPYDDWRLLAFHEDAGIGIKHLAAATDHTIWWDNRRDAYVYRYRPLAADRQLRGASA